MGTKANKVRYLVEICYHACDWVGGRLIEVRAGSEDDAWEIACDRVRRRVPHATIDEGTVEVLR